MISDAVFAPLTLKERIILAPKLASSEPWSEAWFEVFEEAGHWFRFYCILRHARETCER